MGWSVLDALRNNPDLIRNSLKKRCMDFSLLDKALELDRRWRELLTETNKLREERNRINREIGSASGEEKEALIGKSRELAKRLGQMEKELKKIEDERNSILMDIPNLVHESVPEGPDESYNVPVRFWGVPKVPKSKLEVFKEECKGFDVEHEVLEHEVPGHADLMEEIFRLINTKKAGKVAGSRFFYLLRDVAIMDLALQAMALDHLIKKGFTPVVPPFMLKEEFYTRVTDLETFKDAIYKVEKEDLYLIATSEHPIAALHAGDTFTEDELPRLYAGVSPCFRKEAGSHGKDTKGIFRVHQFSKVEQFVFCVPEESWEWHERLIRNAEEVYQMLGLPYRVVNIAGGDLGYCAAKKYDLEVWFPSQGRYREVVSCSNVTDWQSYRLRIKVARKGRKDLVHTLNSTALATTRTICAIFENYYSPEEKIVKVPDKLRHYMRALGWEGDHITPLEL